MNLTINRKLGLKPKKKKPKWLVQTSAHPAKNTTPQRPKSLSQKSGGIETRDPSKSTTQIKAEAQGNNQLTRERSLTHIKQTKPKASQTRKEPKKQPKDKPKDSMTKINTQSITAPEKDLTPKGCWTNQQSKPALKTTLSSNL